MAILSRINLRPFGFGISNLRDPLTWEALSYYEAQARPDNIVTLYVDHREVWLYGSQSIEVWTPTGRPSNDLQGIGPFARMQGVFIEQGIAAPWAVQALDNTLYYLGGTPRGEGPVWKSQGYQPVPVSNHALTLALSALDSIAGAISFVARHGMHAWYGLWLEELDDLVLRYPHRLLDRTRQGWPRMAPGAVPPISTVAPLGCTCGARGGMASGGRGIPRTTTTTRRAHCARIGPWARDEQDGKPITFALLRCVVSPGKGSMAAWCQAATRSIACRGPQTAPSGAMNMPALQGASGRANGGSCGGSSDRTAPGHTKWSVREPILCWRGISINGD